MAGESKRNLSRDVEATVVPSGEKILIPEGAGVTITHRLGGNFTVVWEYGMARIMGKDADALGEEVEVDEAAPADANHSGPPSEDDLWVALRKVFDPEIPVNIVDLGLVYSLDVNESGDNAYKVTGKMTLTAPGCGMGPAIADDAKQNLLRVPGVTEAEMEIVWDPPWNQDMISEEGKMHLGLI